MMHMNMTPAKPTYMAMVISSPLTLLRSLP